MNQCEIKMQNLTSRMWEGRWAESSDQYKAELRRLCALGMHAAETKVAVKYADIQALLRESTSNTIMLPTPQRTRLSRLWREISTLVEEWYVPHRTKSSVGVCLCMSEGK